MYGIEGLLAGRTLLDRYRVDAVIGRGGMGAVYRAYDTRLGREVAVKVISVAAADEDMHERLRARFHREARAAATLHHPNVVAVFDYGTDAELGLDFLVMELLRGEDLASRLSRKGSPAPGAAVEILYQAARGLAAGHRAGLIHRDVKPGNLFLEPGDRPGDVQVKVLDFGIAEMTVDGDQTMTHLTVVGRSPFSPAYASPEQLRGDRLTPATDVFSLGAVAFHMLTGRRAFGSSDPRQLVVELSASMAEEMPRIRATAPGLARVVQTALAPDPGDRFASAGAMVQALAPLAGESPERTVIPGGDHTVFMEEREEPRRRPERLRVPEEDSGRGTFALAPDRTGTRIETGVGGPLSPGFRPRHPAAGSPAAAPLAPAQPPPRVGWLRRTARAAWSFTLTAASVALFAGSWLLAITALQESEIQMVFAGATAAVVLTPLAVHRLTGQRGSYRFALFGSIAASLATLYLLGRSATMETVLGGLFLAQTGASLLAERLTRGRARPSSGEFGGYG